MAVNQALIAAAIVGGVDLIVIPVLVRGMIDSCWKPIEDAYPFDSAPPPSPRAVRREFCSLKLGMMGVSRGMHVTADETHLRLEPCRVCRWFGMRAAAVPWAEITFVRQRSTRTSVVRIRGVEVAGPRDLLSLTTA